MNPRGSVAATASLSTSGSAIMVVPSPHDMMWTAASLGMFFLSSRVTPISMLPWFRVSVITGPAPYKLISAFGKYEICVIYFIAEKIATYADNRQVAKNVGQFQAEEAVGVALNRRHPLGNLELVGSVNVFQGNVGADPERRRVAEDVHRAVGNGLVGFQKWV